MTTNASTLKELSPYFEANGHFRARAFKALTSGLTKDGKIYVLDLGSASSLTLDFFSKYHASIRVEDLAQTLEECGRLDSFDLTKPIPRFEELFAFRDGTRFDVILCWDLLNFLSADELTDFSLFMSHYATPQALLYAHFFSHKSIPQKPGRYRIEAADVVSFSYGSELARGRTGFSQTQIKKLMPHFQIKASFLQRQGIREEVYSSITF